MNIFFFPTVRNYFFFCFLKVTLQEFFFIFHEDFYSFGRFCKFHSEICETRKLPLWGIKFGGPFHPFKMFIRTKKDTYLIILDADEHIITANKSAWGTSEGFLVS